MCINWASREGCFQLTMVLPGCSPLAVEEKLARSWSQWMEAAKTFFMFYHWQVLGLISHWLMLWIPVLQLVAILGDCGIFKRWRPAGWSSLLWAGLWRSWPLIPAALCSLVLYKMRRPVTLSCCMSAIKFSTWRDWKLLKHKENASFLSYLCQTLASHRYNSN